MDELLLPFTRRKLGSSSNSNRYKSHKDNAQGKNFRKYLEYTDKNKLFRTVMSLTLDKY